MQGCSLRQEKSDAQIGLIVFPAFSPMNLGVTSVFETANWKLGSAEYKVTLLSEPGGQAMEQPAGAKEVNVSEGAEEKEPLHAGGEADEVEQEPAPLLHGGEPVQSLDRVHPAHAERGLLLGGRDVLHRSERPGAGPRGPEPSCRGGSSRTGRAAPPRRAGARGTFGLSPTSSRSFVVAALIALERSRLSLSRRARDVLQAAFPPQRPHPPGPTEAPAPPSPMH